MYIPVVVVVVVCSYLIFTNRVKFVNLFKNNVLCGRYDKLHLH